MRYIDSKFLVLIKNNFAFTQPIENIIDIVKVCDSAILDLQIAIPIYMIGSASSKSLSNALMHIAIVIDDFNSISSYFRMHYKSIFNIDDAVHLSSKLNTTRVSQSIQAQVDTSVALQAESNFRFKSTAIIHARWDKYLESKEIVREIYKAEIDKCSSIVMLSKCDFSTIATALLDSATITELRDAIGVAICSSNINISSCYPLVLGQCSDLIKSKAYASKLDIASVLNPTSIDGFKVGSYAAMDFIYMAGLCDIDNLLLKDIDSLKITELDFIGGN